MTDHTEMQIPDDVMEAAIAVNGMNHSPVNAQLHSMLCKLVHKFSRNRR